MPAARPFTPTEERIGSAFIHYVARVNTWLYRASGGRVFGKWLHGAPIGLLTYRGRKSRGKFTTPLLYLRDGDRIVIVASKGGMSHHPLWYRNLVDGPECEFEIGSQRRPYRARTATPEEKKSYWPRLVAMYPDYGAYQARTDRDIPVVILEPR
ncbi:MAG: nitroreductase family deazaflavin-dependent oxidoreductase [Candidatus Binatia bacterium]